MWARKRLDIDWLDVAYGLLRCPLPCDSAALQHQVETWWNRGEECLACLSVRSGFDLLLSELALPARSEVLISALTIPDMPRILAEHGVVPVPIDLETSSLGPEVESLRRAITSQTRAVVVAHLCGGRGTMNHVAAVARQHGLMVIEDCAQAFDGHRFLGHSWADVSMFSFGTIKTATALGGAVLRVRNAELLRRMRSTQAAYPRQGRWPYFCRLLKSAAMKSLSSRRLFSLLVRVCRMAGRDYDHWINAAARGFPGPDLLAKIRQRPCGPLLAVLTRRLRRYPDYRLARRRSAGELLARLLAHRAVCPGLAVADHNYWVFPVLTEEPQRLIDALRIAGFDATQGQSMSVVDPPPQRPEQTAITAQNILAKIVYLPIYPEMPEHALRRMAQVVLEAGSPPSFPEVSPSGRFSIRPAPPQGGFPSQPEDASPRPDVQRDFCDGNCSCNHAASSSDSRGGGGDCE